jgi:hypothetical protein
VVDIVVPYGGVGICNITFLCRANRQKVRPVDYPTVPGWMVMIDIIPSPFPCGLNKTTHFLCFLLIVNVESHLPVLLGLHCISSRAVFTKLQLYCINFQPDAEHVCADAGSQFASQEFVDFCNRKNI